MVPASRAPEHVSATVTVGSTVTGESLDYPSDIDSFTLHATPGASLRLDFHKDTYNPFVSMVAHDAVTGQLLAWYSTAGGDTSQPNFTVPATGNVRLMVLEGFYCQGAGSCDFAETGPYSFTVR